MLENLRKLRNEMGISQEYLGTAIGLSQQTINQYENHSTEPDIYSLKLLADFFDTSVDYLVGHSEERNLFKGGTALSLSEREETLITSFRKLNNSEKESIEAVIKNYIQ